MYIEYGSPVAFRDDYSIRFGVVMEIVTRQGASGETKEFHVETVNADGEKSRVILHDEDDLLNIQQQVYRLGDFAKEVKDLEWTKKVAKALFPERSEE